jgi:hypothetical protein
LFVDVTATGAPADRWFRSLPAAFRGFRRLDDRWKPSAWIIEYHQLPVIGGIPTVRNVVHLQHGELLRNGS